MLTATVIVGRTLVMQDGDFINARQLRVIGSCAALCNWIQLVFWMRLFDSTAMYVSLIIRTIKDISYFMIVMMLIIFGFATAFYLLQMNRVYQEYEEDDLLYPISIGEHVGAKSLKLQYYMMLGDFENINLDSEILSQEALATIFFILTTFLVQVTILNMLIAIMSKTFEEHMSEQDVQSKKQKLLLLSEYIEFVEFYMNTCCRCLRKENPLYVLIMQPKVSEGAAGAEEADENESEVSLLRR